MSDLAVFTILVISVAVASFAGALYLGFRAVIAMVSGKWSWR